MWEFSVPKSQYLKIIKFLHSCHKNGHTFDWRYRFTFLPVIGRFIRKQPDTWFCSELIATALINAQFITNDGTIDARKITPQILFDLTKDKGYSTQKSDLKMPEITVPHSSRVYPGTISVTIEKSNNYQKV